MFDLVKSFTLNWGIQINTEKCKTILMRRAIQEEARLKPTGKASK